MSEHYCGECGKSVNWRTNDCIWMCRRHKQHVYRLFFHIQCFEAIAGREHLENIVTAGANKYDDRQQRKRNKEQ